MHHQDLCPPIIWYGENPRNVDIYIIFCEFFVWNWNNNKTFTSLQNCATFVPLQYYLIPVSNGLRMHFTLQYLIFNNLSHSPSSLIMGSPFRKILDLALPGTQFYQYSKQNKAKKENNYSWGKLNTWKRAFEIVFYFYAYTHHTLSYWSVEIEQS